MGRVSDRAGVALGVQNDRVEAVGLNAFERLGPRGARGLARDVDPLERAIRRPGPPLLLGPRKGAVRGAVSAPRNRRGGRGIASRSRRRAPSHHRRRSDRDRSSRWRAPCLPPPRCGRLRGSRPAPRPPGRPGEHALAAIRRIAAAQNHRPRARRRPVARRPPTAGRRRLAAPRPPARGEAAPRLPAPEPAARTMMRRRKWRSKPERG